MEISHFSLSPVPKIIFGPSRFETLPEIIQNFGSTVLILTGKSSIEKSGRLDFIINRLNNSKISYYIEKINSEPSPEVINILTEKYLNNLPDVLVSIGGGSVLDSGKALSAMLAEGGHIEDYLEDIGSKKPTGRKLPFIAVPTTSGTGSEATKNAVISKIGIRGYKKSLRHENYIPDIALLDPELTTGLPLNLTVSTGMDALSQLIESYISSNANPVTDTLAIDGIKNISEAITKFSDPTCNELLNRSKMTYGALLSGITLANAGLTIIHSIAGTIGGYYNTAHGNLCAALMPYGLEIILEEAIKNEKSPESQILIKKYSKIYEVITQNSSLNHMDAAKKLIQVLIKWHEILKIKKLSDLGIQNTDLKKFADSSANKNTPVQLNKNDVLKILKNAF